MAEVIKRERQLNIHKQLPKRTQRSARNLRLAMQTTWNIRPHEAFIEIHGNLWFGDRPDQASVILQNIQY